MVAGSGSSRAAHMQALAFSIRSGGVINLAIGSIRSLLLHFPGADDQQQQSKNNNSNHSQAQITRLAGENPVEDARPRGFSNSWIRRSWANLAGKLGNN